MGCSYPIKIKNIHYKSGSVILNERVPYFFVPCGKCLGCQISKRTWLSTACNYEYNKYGIGAFITLTYDDTNQLRLYNEEQNGFTLDYRDFQLFMKRLRENLFRKYGRRVDFKYLAVGEYGLKNGRSHYHVLFFGLDWRREDKIIWDSWQNGITDSKPIKEGGINYVLKYLDKAEMRKKEKGFRNYEKPFIKYSKGLGKGFIDENLKDIYENNGLYLGNNFQRHSLPPYWLDKLNIKPPKDYTEIKKEIAANKKQRDWQTISKTECMKYLAEHNRMNEEKAIRASRDKGIPQEDFDTLKWEVANNEKN